MILNTDTYNVYTMPDGKVIRYDFDSGVQDSTAARVTYTVKWTEEFLSEIQKQQVAMLATHKIYNELSALYQATDYTLYTKFKQLADSSLAQYKVLSGQISAVCHDETITPWCTLKDLNIKFGAKALLTKVAKPTKSGQLVIQDYEILTAFIDGFPLTGFSVSDQEHLAYSIPRLCAEVLSSNVMIDEVLKDYYTLPNIPKNLTIVFRDAACNIVNYKLYDAGQFKKNDVVKERYEAALVLIKQYATGNLTLPGQSKANSINWTSKPRMFSGVKNGITRYFS